MIPRLTLLGIAAVTIISPAFGQTECTTGRYVTYDLFPGDDITSAVVFGSNTSVAGAPQTLRMDIYEPPGDVQAERPVVVVAFGGSFVGGARADVAELCKILARLGYVAVAPDYRVGFFLPNELNTTLAVVRSMHDIKGAVRFLRKTYAEDGNPYGIDPDRIIIGGVSAGAIGALHATYMDDISEMPAVLAPYVATLGGIEGNSGSPTYSSDVLACYSFSGAIGDTLWMQPGDQPLASVHEVGDQVVPYDTQIAQIIGIPTGLLASGSGDIHKRLDHIGVPNCFLSYPGAGHVGYLTSDQSTSVDHVVQFLARVVCNEPAGCGTLYASMAEHMRTADIIAWPNPTHGPLVVQVERAVQVLICDGLGRVVAEHRLAPGQNTLDLSTLAPGVYHLRALEAGGPVRTIVRIADR